jgi:demethylmenaquinone methyltransferase/2-methoxy-6-polyprenyl-1,4-benzoquinol methylase
MLDHFGFIAPFYDKVLPLRDPEALIRRLDLPTQGALLDAGGGTGRVSAALNGFASHIFVVDVSEGMLSQAADKLGLQPVCSESERLPFPEASFERIVMVDALHHVAQQAQTAAELWRVLRPGGRLVIEEPDIRTWPVKLIAIAEKLAWMRSHFLSPEEILEIFQTLAGQPAAQGFRIERQKYNAWVIIEKPPAA